MTPADFRAARHKFGLTQTEWGHLLGLTRVQITRLETGTSAITLTLVRLVEMYERHGISSLTNQRPAIIP